MRILLIEDEIELGRLGAQQLQMLGHKVTTVVSIEEARKLWKPGSELFDLVLSDHRLPDGRGVDFIMDLKKEYPRLKYAVVSGCLTLADRQMLKAANIPFFLKPILYSAVLKELRKPPPFVSAQKRSIPDPDEIPLPEPIGGPQNADLCVDHDSARGHSGGAADTGKSGEDVPLSEPQVSPDMISKALKFENRSEIPRQDREVDEGKTDNSPFARLLERFKRKNRRD